VTFVGSFFNGSQWGGRRFNNSLRILGGLFQTDENRNFWGNAGMLVSRWTWEGIQTWAGYGYSSSRNALGYVDRVDYLGGATFATNENAGKEDGISIGSFINTNIREEITGDFEDYVITHPMYMHEYGHTIDSRLFGLSYLFAVGIPSLISVGNSEQISGEVSGVSTHDKYWTEMRANKRAKKYFGKHYGVDWNTSYKGYDYEAFYPTIWRW
jgi:hypothetical protein